jgi:hypothetical protein
MIGSTEENDGFAIRGENGNYIKVGFSEVYGFPNETCHWGGYDSRASIEIEVDGFKVVSFFYTSTGQVYNLYQQIANCNSQLRGTAKFLSYEDNLELTANYGLGGNVEIAGRYSTNSHFINELNFSFATDQSFIDETINQMKLLVAKYGDNRGVKK